MPQTKPQQQPPQAPELPPIPKLVAKAKHFTVFLALEADAAAQHLWEHRVLMMRREFWHQTPANQACSAGWRALTEVNHLRVMDARRMGELLFCWHGTKAIEVQL